MNASDLIKEMASQGRYHFTSSEAEEILGSSPFAARAVLRRLKKKGAIATPYRGFHVIVPPEYSSLGCLPAVQFIPQLMEHLGLRYYVGLLSAAELHGAAHQRPQISQVVVKKNRPSIDCGRVKVVFISRKNVGDLPAVRMNTPRGYVLVSSSETTAFDIVGYRTHSGGFDNIANVLRELSDKLDPDKLAHVAGLSPLSWAQRLGYLIERFANKDQTGPLHDYVSGQVKEYVPLRSDRSVSEASREKRWKLFLNEIVEPDL